MSNISYPTRPDRLISKETLIYVGLSEENADDKWAQWTNRPECPRETDGLPEDERVTFLDFILEPIKRMQDAPDETDAAWYKCMNDCGISAELQSAIMDDDFFTYLRLSNSCLFWVVDTIDMRYGGLKMSLG
ncbi:hypothetical protein QBC39DRAFT_328771 [Podospora conica]|nr:hypothetical protein QBC39DRAFT_328771 [Schizothecium conicum]